MRAVIFANGLLSQPFTPHPGDLILAADGGAHHCLALDIDPAAVIGDMDSLNSEELALLKSRGAKIVVFPTHKDYTDLELALEYAQDQGASRILILAALGERWDQTITNLLLPAAFTSIQISLIDSNQEIHFIHGQDEFEIHGQPNDLVSLIPLAGNASGITTQGLEYPLSDETLYFGRTRGVSNTLLGEKATVVLKEGLLLCTIIHTNEHKT